MTPLCHVTASSSCNDLLVIHTPSLITDINLMAPVDSGATQNYCSDSYVREKLLSTHSRNNLLLIRLADGSMSMARYGFNIEFHIGSLKISQEFFVTRLSGHHQIILGYEFLKNFNPHIDWTAGTLRFNDMETAQTIVTKRKADVKRLSGKQMSRLLNKEINRN
jgi:hypothetical protein